MKNERQAAILELLRNRRIETQSGLAEALRESGYQVTQATVSRDIREMGLVKISTGDGGYQYSPPGNETVNISERLSRILQNSLLQAESAGHMVVVKTLSGSANSAAEALDSLHWPGILGSIAGDNTIFLVAKNEEEAADTVVRIRNIAGQQGEVEA